MNKKVWQYGGYLHLIDNNIPLEYIHTEYSIFKDALRAGDKDIYMKYKDQIQTRCEAISNILETLKRGLESNAISKTEAVNIIIKLQTINKQIENFTELEG